MGRTASKQIKGVAAPVPRLAGKDLTNVVRPFFPVWPVVNAQRVLLSKPAEIIDFVEWRRCLNSPSQSINTGEN